MSSPKEIAQFLEDHWYKKSGLAAAVIISISAAIALLTSANAGLLLGLGLTAVLAISIYVLWRYTTRPPVVPKDKVGFLVCITCSDEEELKTIIEDFITPLRQLVKSGRAGNTFHFVEMSQHFARQVMDADSANEMRIRCKAHFGRIRNSVCEGSLFTASV